jgi:hypothetical protein
LTVVAGGFRLENTTAAAARARQNISGLVVGRTYFVSARKVGGAGFRLSVNDTHDSSAFTGNLFAGSIDLVVAVGGFFTATTTICTVICICNTTTAGGNVTFADVTLYELDGNHAQAPSDAARPLLGREPEGGARNLVLSSADANNTTNWAISGVPTITDGGAWTEGRKCVIASGGATFHRRQTANMAFTAGQVLRVTLIYEAGTSGRGRVIFRNTATASNSTLTGNVGSLSELDSAAGTITSLVNTDLGSGRYKASFTITLAASGNCNFGLGPDSDTAGQTVVLLGVQVELGTTETPFQRVGTTALDVTEAGKRDLYYLQFNGSTSTMQSNNINLTTLTEATAIAGLRNLSNATRAMYFGFGNPAEANASGVFDMGAPNANGENNFGGGVKLTSASGRTYSTPANFPAPRTAVITAKCDVTIANNPMAVRVDGENQIPLTYSGGLDAGANLGNFPVHLGARNSNTLWFAGRIYSVFFRAGPLAADDRAIVEKFNAQKAGATLL